jgi:hypothetical protein
MLKSSDELVAVMNYATGTGGDRGGSDRRKAERVGAFCSEHRRLDAAGEATRCADARATQINGRVPVTNAVRMSASRTSPMNSCDLRVICRCRLASYDKAAELTSQEISGPLSGLIGPTGPLLDKHQS